MHSFANTSSALPHTTCLETQEARFAGLDLLPQLQHHSGTKSRFALVRTLARQANGQQRAAGAHVAVLGSATLPAALPSASHPTKASMAQRPVCQLHKRHQLLLAGRALGVGCAQMRGDVADVCQVITVWREGGWEGRPG